MKANTPKQHQESAAEPLLVTAKAIARDLSCTPRFVHMLHEQGKIPGYRFGKACIRFNRAEVLRSIGITTEAGAAAGAKP